MPGRLFELKDAVNSSLLPCEWQRQPTYPWPVILYESCPTSFCFKVVGPWFFPMGVHPWSSSTAFCYALIVAGSSSSLRVSSFFSSINSSRMTRSGASRQRTAVWSACRTGCRTGGSGHLADRDAHDVFCMRDRNNSSVQADAGSTGIVQAMFSGCATEWIACCSERHDRSLTKARPGGAGSG